MTAKEIVTKFFSTDLVKNEASIDFFHKDCMIHWNSSLGLSVIDYNNLLETFSEIKETYTSFAFETSHILSEDNQVTVRYTIFATTIEKPTTDIPLGHFISIVEIKEDKIYRIYQISQQADESIKNMSAF